MNNDFDLLIDYNPDTGVCKWKTRTNRRNKAGDEIGCSDKDGYLLFKLNKVTYRIHRVIWFMVHSEWPEQIDHINGDPSDNRLCNLRAVTMKENMLNRKLDKRSTTGVAGVIPSNGRYKCYINKDGVEHFLGYFADLFEAACARKSAENRLGFHANHGAAR